jgi:RecB family endonuclease NucS
MKLDRPLLFDKKLAQKLSLNIKFSPDKTETQAIGSATRSYRELTDKDVKTLKKEIDLSKKSKKVIETILSTDEVTEIIEKDLEGFIEKDPSLIGKSLKHKRRQADTPVGRVDLYFEDRKRNPVIVELKLNKIGRDALKQIKRYMKWAEKETKRKAKGIIVCRGVMPAFQDEFRKLQNIKIFTYGWQLSINPWKI